MEKKKRTRAKSTPAHIPGAPIAVVIWLSEEIYPYAKGMARSEHRSLNAFCLTAVEEKVARMQENDIDAKGFVPPYLRK